MATFNGTVWTGVNFSSPQYAQLFQQLIADLYAAYRVGGYYLIGTTAGRAPATGSQSWTVAVDTNYLGLGAFVVITSAINPTTNYCAGVVTAANTSSITVNCLVSAGAISDSSWNISVIGSIRTTAPGSTRMGQTGQTTALTALTALNLDTPTTSAESIYDDFMGALVTSSTQAYYKYLDRWVVYQGGSGVLQSNAAPLYAGDLTSYNLVPGNATPVTTDWASHPGVLALEATVAADLVNLSYGNHTGVGVYAISNTSAFVLDVHIKIPTANTLGDFFTFSTGLTAYAGPAGSGLLANDGLYIVIGRGTGFDPMQPYALQMAGGVPTWTAANYSLVPGKWYTLRLQRTRISVIGSDNNMANSPQSVILGTNTFTASSIAAALLPSMLMSKTAGATKRAVLVDYYAFKPGALTR